GRQSAAPEARDDLAAGLPEGRGELLLRDVEAVLAGHQHPALEVRAIGVDQHAVDVEDHRPRSRSHPSFLPDGPRACNATTALVGAPQTTLDCVHGTFRSRGE